MYVVHFFEKKSTKKLGPRQSVGENEYILIRDSARFSEDFGLVE